MIDLSRVVGLSDSKGVIVQVTDENGKVLWVLNTNKPVYLQVKTMVSDTYVSSTSYTGEEFIRLNVYVKPEGTVNVTYGGVTKTVTNTSTTADSVSYVVFGTYGGVSYGAVPSSGELVIEGDCVAFAESSFNTEKSTTVSTSCVVSIKDSGSITSVPASAFKRNLNLTSAVLLSKNLKSIEGNAFQGCTSLSSVQLGENLESLGANAFQNCTGLSSIQLGENLKTIENYAFQGCTSLPRIHIPANVESILGSSFMGCSSLSNISIDSNNGVYYTPDGRAIITKNGKVLITAPSASGTYTVPSEVVEIGEYALYGTGLTGISFPVNLTTVGNNAFANTGITSLTVPKQVKSWGSRAFYSNSSLTSVTIPQGATLGIGMFEGCTALTSISIPSGITEIPSSFCEGCYNLTSVSLPEGLTTIGKNAFDGGMDKPMKLASVTIPSTVTFIGDFAFWGTNPSADKVFYMRPTTPPTLETDAAICMSGGYNVSTIYVPRGCGEAYRTAKYWSVHADRIVEADL